MTDFTKPTNLQLIDSFLAQILSFDTSGVELFVAKNTPKTLNALIKRIKVFYKDKPNVDPYVMAYTLHGRFLPGCQTNVYQ